jgi:hypothetical protein
MLDMAALVHSFVLLGIDALPVTITVDSATVKISGGFHAAAYTSLGRLPPPCGGQTGGKRGQNDLIRDLF